MIDLENLKNIINEIMENENQDLKDLVSNIVIAIDKLPTEEITTIAKLIGYNPENSIVDPLTQGKVFSCVRRVCKTLNIMIEKTYDGFGGLAYNYDFKKIN